MLNSKTLHSCSPIFQKILNKQIANHSFQIPEKKPLSSWANIYTQLLITFTLIYFQSIIKALQWLEVCICIFLVQIHRNGNTRSWLYVTKSYIFPAEPCICTLSQGFNHHWILLINEKKKKTAYSLELILHDWKFQAKSRQRYSQFCNVNTAHLWYKNCLHAKAFSSWMCTMDFESQTVPCQFHG